MPTPDKAKKLRERYLLECLASSLRLDLEIIAEREAPDFHCRCDGKTIGVELVELYVTPGKRGDTLQAQEAIARQIVGRAQTLYQAAGGPWARVSVLFGIGHDLRCLNRERTASEISELVLSRRPLPGQRIVWHPTTLKEPLPHAVSYVQVLGVPDPGMARWASPSSGWVHSLTAEMLAGAIAKKAAALGTYSASFPENWLVIIADGTRPSSLIRMTDGLDVSAITSPFARTFLYQHPEGGVELGR